MSFAKCIVGKAESGLLKKSQVEQLERKYDNLVAKYTETMGDADAAVQAAQDVVKAEISLITQKQRNKIKAALHQEITVNKLKQKMEVQNKTMTQVYGDLMQRAAQRGEGIFKRALAITEDFVEKNRSKFAGLVADRSEILNIYRELGGADSGSKVAKTMAKGVKDAMDYLHAEYRKAGGVIGKIDNYYPQFHDARKMRATTFDDWYADIRPRLDMDKMTNMETGLRFTEDELLEVSRNVYEDIISNGRTKISKAAEEGKQKLPFGGDLSERKAHSRFFHFKSPDDFFEYNRKFGVGDEGLFDSITNQMQSFSRDTGIMQIMGARPNAFHRHMQLQQLAQPKSTQVGVNINDGRFKVLTGQVDQVADDALWYRTLANLQKLKSAAVLGSASLSAISDTAYTAMAASINGLSAAKTMQRYFKGINPASAAERKLARRHGYIAEQASASFVGEAKFGGDIQAGKVSSFLSGFTIRASGLEAMTLSAKNSIALEAEATLAEQAGKAWGDLNPNLREALGLFDIGQKDWDVIRASTKFSPSEGVEFIRSKDIADVEVGLKVDDWIFEMRRLASNEPSLRERAITTGAIFGDARQGTLLRLVSNSLFMFKSFPIAVINNHLIPALRRANIADTLKATGRLDFGEAGKQIADARYGYLGGVMVGTTVMGAFAIQLKDLVAGKSPRDTNDVKFWKAAALQGGGLGLFGDFLYADRDRYGNTPEKNLAGFAPMLVGDVLNTVNAIVTDIADGKKGSQSARQLTSLAKQFTPAHSLWYGRLAIERNIFDQIEKAMDSKYSKKIRASEKKMYKETKQKYWWKRGERLPK